MAADELLKLTCLEAAALRTVGERQAVLKAVAEAVTVEMATHARNEVYESEDTE